MGTFTEVKVTEFHVETCCNCGVQFGMPQDYHRQKRNRRGSENSFYCPNGHRQWYTGETEAEKLRRERDLARQQLARAEQEAAEERERAAKAERAKKRLEKRVAAGTCPCCQRTFSNMTTHMRKQHPEFVAENVVSRPARTA